MGDRRGGMLRLIHDHYPRVLLMPSVLTATRNQERAALIGVATGRKAEGSTTRSMEELAALASAAGARVVFSVLQQRPAIDAATFVGQGKAAALAASGDAQDIELVIFDNELSPAQLRNLEKIFGCKVLDRTQLILDIFAQRARSREGRLQVELAQLRYLLPRLVGAGTALSRLGAGIGTRGPGETKLESDRRRIRLRIDTLTRAIEGLRQRRGRLRERRRRHDIPIVALVGYTNAGKTTLFNRLTQSAADMSNALFVTLDPLVRQVRLPDRRELLLSDTVGFVDRLPHTLVAAFRATLEEVRSADLLLHVIDAANPNSEQQIAAVNRVLEEVGAEDVPLVEAWNKWDLVDGQSSDVPSDSETSVRISALTGEGCEQLIQAIAKHVGLDERRVSYTFPAQDPRGRARVAYLYRHATVVRHEVLDGHVTIEAIIPRRLMSTLSAIRFGEEGGHRPRHRIA